LRNPAATAGGRKKSEGWGERWAKKTRPCPETLKSNSPQENSDKQRNTSSIFGGERCGAVFRFGHNLIAVEEKSAKFDSATRHGIPGAYSALQKAIPSNNKYQNNAYTRR
jgi:hypothetical protein